MLGAIVSLILILAAAFAVTKIGGAITLLFIAAVLFLAYRRLSLLTFTITFTVLFAAYTALGAPANLWKGFLGVLLAVLWLLNVRPLRKALITRPFMKAYLRLLPSMSQTEKEALDAGTVWWDGELFSCSPRGHRSCRPRSRPSSPDPARSCATCSMTGTSPTSAATCRRRCGSSSRRAASSP